VVVLLEFGELHDVDFADPDAATSMIVAGASTPFAAAGDGDTPAADPVTARGGGGPRTTQAERR